MLGINLFGSYNLHLVLGINLFGSYNLHLVLTKLSSRKKIIVESTGRNNM